jgi:hypothetical protein
MSAVSRQAGARGETTQEPAVVTNRDLNRLSRKAVEIDLKGTLVAHFDFRFEAVLMRVGCPDMAHLQRLGPARRFGRELGVARVFAIGQVHLRVKNTQRLDAVTISFYQHGCR